MITDRSSRLHLTIQTHKHVINITYRPEEQDLCAVTGDVSHGAFTYLTFGQLAAEKKHLKENIDIFRSLFELWTISPSRVTFRRLLCNMKNRSSQLGAARGRFPKILQKWHRVWLAESSPVPRGEFALVTSVFANCSAWEASLTHTSN